MTGQEARSMLKNPKGGGNYPDNFTEDELQQIGLGYDRMVRFMEKDDPNLRHPYDGTSMVNMDLLLAWSCCWRASSGSVLR